MIGLKIIPAFINKYALQKSKLVMKKINVVTINKVILTQLKDFTTVLIVLVNRVVLVYAYIAQIIAIKTIIKNI